MCSSEAERSNIFRPLHDIQIHTRQLVMSVAMTPIEGPRTGWDDMEDIARFHQVDKEGRRPAHVAQKIRVVDRVVRRQHVDDMVTRLRGGIQLSP